MSLESNIKALTDAVNALVTVMSQAQVSHGDTTPKSDAPAVAPVAAEPAATQPAATAAPTPAASVSMPPPPAMEAPAPAAPVAEQPASAATNAPFTNGAELVAYVMKKYQQLGQRGAEIGNILVKLGYQNINDVKPEHYGDLFQAVEALG